jgi:hypothetical protein
MMKVEVAWGAKPSSSRYEGERLCGHAALRKNPTVIGLFNRQ